MFLKYLVERKRIKHFKLQYPTISDNKDRDYFYVIVTTTFHCKTDTLPVTIWKNRN